MGRGGWAWNQNQGKVVSKEVSQSRLLIIPHLFNEFIF